MKTIKQILIERDGIEPSEADEMIEAARTELIELIEAGEFMAADEICYNHFGLEPDYLEELL